MGENINLNDDVCEYHTEGKRCDVCWYREPVEDCFESWNEESEEAVSNETE